MQLYRYTIFGEFIMQFYQEIEIDGVYHNVEYSILCDYCPGEPPTYYGDLACPGEDSYVDIWDVQVIKIDGYDANSFTTDVVDKFKAMLDTRSFEEEYLDHISALNEIDDDRYDHEPD